MKKVKILLSVAAVVAVVAGASASKARLSHVIYTPDAQGACKVVVQSVDITAENPNGILATAQFNAPCKKVLTRTAIND